jgi:ABC-type transport system involved in multi-copper enzyme maturation permease subunit
LLSSFWAITKNSFREIIRQPVYGILLLSGMTLIGFSPAITMFSMEDEKLLVDMGLATILLLGLVLAVLSATHVVTREIDSQTVGTIVSKAVDRFTFVVAKFAAVSLAMAAASYLLTLMLLMALRMGVPSTADYSTDYPVLLAELGPLLLAVGLGIYCNFFYRWSFTSTAVLLALCFYTLAFGLLLLVGPGWSVAPLPPVFAARHAAQVALAALLVFMGVWVLSSVAVVLSTRVNVVLSSIMCVVVFFVGMTSQFLFGQFAAGHRSAWVALRLVPNLYVFWVGDQLMMEVPYVPLTYVARAAAYAAGFCAAMVFLAGYFFERREVT